MQSKDIAEALLVKYIKNPSLLNHSRMVAHAMESYALSLSLSDAEALEWWSAGLLHDLDWEMFPDVHPNKAVNEILPSHQYSVSVLNAIRAHAPQRTGKTPEALIEKYLFACDEICGFINAISLLRPNGFKGMEVKSVTKRLKEPRFAANVSREDISHGVTLIGKTIEDHVSFLLNIFQDWHL